MKKFLMVLLLSGCTSFVMPSEFTYQEINTPQFKIAAWVKKGSSYKPYKVYIEGDGRAFNAHGSPTANPTPKSTLVRELAVRDNNANVIYLARPCQYVTDSKCAQKYWTIARFAPEVIDAEYFAIKQLAENNDLTLIGFSGGAQIAGLLAVSKNDLHIRKVITVAGNLDHVAWMKYHNLPQLTLSLNLADYRQEFMKISQFHYVGAKDEIIPPLLTEQFINNDKLISIIPDASHNSGWDKLDLSQQ